MTVKETIKLKYCIEYSKKVFTDCQLFGLKQGCNRSKAVRDYCKWCVGISIMQRNRITIVAHVLCLLLVVCVRENTLAVMNQAIGQVLLFLL